MRFLRVKDTHKHDTVYDQRDGDFYIHGTIIELRQLFNAFFLKKIDTLGT